MQKKLQLILLLVITVSLQLAAQSKISFDNVRQTFIRNTGQIMDGEELKGYFTFYVTDKKDRKTNAYAIQIMDNNLNKIKEIEFEDDKDVRVLESSYNNNSILFLFYNSKEKTLEYRTYGFDGKIKSTYTRELNNRTKWLIESTYGTKSEKGQNETIFSVGDVGFTTVIPVKEGKYYSYEINFFLTNQKKQWTFEAAEEQEDKVANALYLGATDSLVIYEVIKQKRMMSKEAHSWLLGLNIYTGKKQFEVSTEGEDFKFFPMNIVPLTSKSEFMLLGTYYEPEGRVAKDASLGLASWRFNTAGKVVSKKYNSWEGPIGKFLPADAKGKVADVGYIYFHKVMQTEDGKFFAIGEGYKKVVSGFGVAAGIMAGLGGGTSGISMMKLKITDMILLQFDEQFEIKNAKIYEKNSNTMEMPAGGSYLTPHTMALIAKSFKAFDYDFTLTDKQHTRFSVGYGDYVKDDEYKGRTFNTISYIDGKITTDKINLSSNKATWLRVFPAKPGFIMIMEYFKKDKTLDVRLEKLN
jgi:hypothetical protein